MKPSFGMQFTVMAYRFEVPGVGAVRRPLSKRDQTEEIPPIPMRC